MREIVIPEHLFHYLIGVLVLESNQPSENGNREHVEKIQAIVRYLTAAPTVEAIEAVNNSVQGSPHFTPCQNESTFTVFTLDPAEPEEYQLSGLCNDCIAGGIANVILSMPSGATMQIIRLNND